MGKDAGFKVVTHMMPDLPNVGLERDIEQFIVSHNNIKSFIRYSTLKMQIFLIPGHFYQNRSIKCALYLLDV